ncbi:MAG: carbonic anhydrase family protein [Ilumatobacteraceae bacterium]
MRRPSRHLARLLVTAVAVLVVLPACGGAAAPAAEVREAGEAAPPEVTKDDLEALSIRVLELEVQVKNLRAADATGDPFSAAPIEGAAPEWDYQDPAGWGALGAAYETCAAGTEQSPIDLGPSTLLAADIANPVVDYGDTSTATIIDNGHTIEVGLEGAGTLALEGASYDLQHLHFHAPSEHTIDGVHAPLEVHFVHETVDGNIAVVSALVKAGDAGPAGYDVIVAALPSDDAEHEVGAPLSLRSLLPEQTTAYRYRGSLTTPPCTEGVNWLVLTTPLTMSQAQIDAIVAQLPAPNNRPTQELGGRVVGVDVTS